MFDSAVMVYLLLFFIFSWMAPRRIRYLLWVMLGFFSFFGSSYFFIKMLQVDFFKNLAIALGCALGGILVMVVSFRSYRKQKRLEREVDRIHDAWNSRKSRW